MNDYAIDYAVDLVAKSLTRSTNGALSITPSSELRELAARVPTLRYAAFDPKSRAALAGSSAELAAMLRFSEEFTPTGITFQLGKERQRR